MLLSEIKSEFEILFEDLTTAGTKSLDSYEMSVCLTHAQEEIVRALVANNDLYMIDSIVKFQDAPTGVGGNYPTSFKFTVLDALKILDRIVLTGSPQKQIMATVVTEEQIRSMYTSPYKFPPKNVVYVLIGENAEEVFLPLGYAHTAYKRRYVEYPSPVILETLTGSDSINSLTAPTDPILNESLHRNLVNAAVQYAIKWYVGVEEKPIE